MKNYKKSIICAFLVFLFILIILFCQKISNDKREIICNTSYSSILGDKETGSLFDPFVSLKDNEYTMYVSYRNKRSIALSKSSDGINWSNPKIVLNFDESTGWEYDINRSTVTKYNNKYYMYYTGQQGGISKIGLAISEDGIEFSKYSKEPIMVPEFEYEKESVMNPMVIFDEEEKIFKMWYSAGETYEPDVICYATSKDGIHFEKYNNPIFEPSNDKETLDYYKIGAVDIHKLSSDSYIMFYIGYTDIDTARIFYATSKDGIVCKRYNKEALVEPNIFSFAKDAVYKPSVVFLDNKNFNLYFNGRTKYHEYIGISKCKINK